MRIRSRTAKRHQFIPDRHAHLPTFSVPTSLFRHTFRLRGTEQFPRVPCPIFIEQLAKAPRQVWNLTRRVVAELLYRAENLTAINTLLRWFKAASAFRVSASDWNAMPYFPGAAPASYVALTNSGHMLAKRAVITEKYIAHDNGSRRL